jgi:hypothetical protein
MFRGTGLRNNEYGMRTSANVSLRSWPRRESPKPNAENEGYDQRDPAQAHRDRERSDGDLGLVDQPQEMRNCKNAEENARDAQSSSW